MSKKKGEVWLNLGCGVHALKDFINVDAFFTEKDLKSKKGLFALAEFDKGAEFVQADMRKLPFPDEYADYIETVDAIEHVPWTDTDRTFKEFYRVLKPGGKLALATTNFDQLAQFWVQYVAGKYEEINFKELQEIIYGNQRGPGEFHTACFNPPYMGVCLKKAGFDLTKCEIRVYPMGSHWEGFIGFRSPKGSIIRNDLMAVYATK